MNLFDIIGPIMVGPSSSHTAGAVRLGNVARAILSKPIAEAEISLYGSFAKTGRGHGTDLALVAGLMGWAPDDLRICQAFEYAKKENLVYSFHFLPSADTIHPNMVKFGLTDIQGTKCDLLGSSVGGGRIMINEIDGFPLEFTGEFPTLITLHEDRPGVIALVTSILSQERVNVAQMKVFRQDKGRLACMVLETDQPVNDEDLAALTALPMLKSVRRIACIG